MVTTTAATIGIVKTAWLAALPLRFWTALVLPLAFRAGTKLRTTIFAAVVAAITATTTTAAAIVLATTVTTAIATFVTTTFARTFVLARSRCCCGGGLLSSVAGKEAFQPAEETRFFGFGHGRRGLRLERARLFATFAELFLALTKLLTAFACRLTTRFARTKIVARFPRLFAAGGAFIAANGHVFATSLGLTVGMACRMKIRTAFAARIGAGSRLFRLAADLPALSRAGFLLGREDFEFGFGFNDRLGRGREGFDPGRSRFWCDDGDRVWGFCSGLLRGDGRDGLLDLRGRFNDCDRNRLGRERIFVLGLMVNDLDGGRLIAATGGIFIHCGGGSGRTRALAARQA